MRADQDEYDQGHSFLERRRFSAALDRFDRCARRGSREYGPWQTLHLLRAICLERVRRPAEARKALEAAIAEAILEHERARLPADSTAMVMREYAALRRWVAGLRRSGADRREGMATSRGRGGGRRGA